MNEHLKHLNLLSTGFYVYAVITFLFALLPFIHLGIGIMIVSDAFNDGKSGNPPPPFFGWFFIIIAAIFILFGMASAICNFLAGRYLKQRKNYIFCLVMGGVNCMFAPLGTVLGVFTLLTLLREPVKELFDSPSLQLEAQPAIMTPPDWR